MYSKVKLADHPLHPMLVSFPIAFYVASLASFITYAATLNPFWFRVAFTANVAGVIMAVIAAIPGLIDWAVGIPNHTEAKASGLNHLICNGTALVLFAFNVY